jgi:hypothetical protein
MVAALNIPNITFPAGITGLSSLPGNGNMPIGDDEKTDFFKGKTVVEIQQKDPWSNQ